MERLSKVWTEAITFLTFMSIVFIFSILDAVYGWEWFTGPTDDAGTWLGTILATAAGAITGLLLTRVEFDNSFRAYLELLFEEWLLRLLLIVDLIGLLVALFWQGVRIPSEAFWLIALVGLLYGSFRVYQKVAPVPEAAEETNLTIELVEGSEYEYSMLDPSSTPHRRQENQIPSIVVTVRARITNPNDSSVTIAKVDARFNTVYEYELPIDTVLRSSFGGLDKPEFPGDLSYPIELAPTQSIPVVFKGGIRLSRLNDTQIAARLKQMVSNPHIQKFAIEVEVLDVQNEIKEFRNVFDVSAMPLRELIFEHWRENGELALLDLAGGSTDIGTDVQETANGDAIHGEVNNVDETKPENPDNDTG